LSWILIDIQSKMLDADSGSCEYGSETLLFRHNSRKIRIKEADLRVDLVEGGLLRVAPVRHLLEALALLVGQVVPPHGALLVELLDLLVDELVRVLALVLGPAGLNEDPVGRVLLRAASLRHGHQRGGFSLQTAKETNKFVKYLQ
jgi:hypothetical protein